MKPMHTFCTSLAMVILAATAAAAPSNGHAIDLRQCPLAAAMDSVSRWFGTPIIYRTDDVEGLTVTFRCDGCSLDEALTGILRGTGLDAQGTTRQVIIRKHVLVTRVMDGTIAGIVRDAVTGDAIAGAIVTLRRQDEGNAPTRFRVCPTNAFGFFSLRALPGASYSLEVHQVGYQNASHILRIGDGGDVRQDVALRQVSIPLEEMTVEGERMTGATGSGLARGLFIRSIPGDPNEYLLDGARIYKPGHAGGVMSTFHPEALNELEIGRAGVPVSFGGRIGGVMDLALRDGMREGITGSAGADLLGLHGAIEGPVSESMAFLVTGRRGWPDAPISGLSRHGAPTALGSTELIAKVSGRLPSGSRLTANAYLNEDALSSGSNNGQGSLSNGFRWWNTTANARWSAVLSSSLFAQVAATYTSYGFSLEHTLSTPSSLVPGSTYRIADVTVRGEAEQYYDAVHTFGGGLEVTRHAIEGAIGAFDAIVAPWQIEHQGYWEIAVFARDRLLLHEDISAEIGVRATSFVGPRTTMSAIDPLIAVHVALSPSTRAYLTFASICQFLHPYRQSGTFLCYPSPFWYPSTEDVSPSTSVQFTAGGLHDLGSGDAVVGVEGFYRLTTGLHDLPGTNTAVADLGTVLSTGRGISYGFDLSLRKRTGPFSGAISYTFTRTERTFTALNYGEPFVPPFTPSHEIHLSAGYVPTEEWMAGVLVVLAPDTWGNERSELTVSASAPTTDVGGVRFAQGSDLSDVNGNRLPAFERLEFTVSRRMSMGMLRGSISLRLISGYGLLDPVEWVSVGTSGGRALWQPGIRPIRLFPLFPVVGVSLQL